MRARWTKAQGLDILGAHLIDYPSPTNLGYLWGNWINRWALPRYTDCNRYILGNALHSTCRFSVCEC